MTWQGIAQHSIAWQGIARRGMQHATVCRPASDPQLMSYRIFLDSFLLPIKVGEGAALDALNTAIKAERQKLKRVFTEAGQPGDMFRSALHQ